MATALEQAVHGSVLMEQARLQCTLSLSQYEHIARLRTCSLISHACFSAAILAGHTADSTVTKAVRAYASDLGLAYQIMADTVAYQLDVVRDEAPVSILTTPPVLLAVESAAQLAKLAVLGTEGQMDTSAVVSIVNERQGVSQAVAFAERASASAEKHLTALPDSRERMALIQLARCVPRPGVSS
mmetsp:Transcript_20314/g.81157  ORF Transcript_20314/g.81157 Transcript_20314/m.81157 type:complete len:185 (-) Transcript_20314:528-1082(-)